MDTVSELVDALDRPPFHTPCAQQCAGNLPLAPVRLPQSPTDLVVPALRALHSPKARPDPPLLLAAHLIPHILAAAQFCIAGS